jgi:hypothetical protein
MQLQSAIVLGCTLIIFARAKGVLSELDAWALLDYVVALMATKRGIMLLF